MSSTRLFPVLTVALLAPAALVALAPQARAQTLADALAQAYANNPTLLAARAQLRSVDENVPQALAGWRPTVSVTSSFGTVTAFDCATAPLPAFARRPGFVF